MAAIGLVMIVKNEAHVIERCLDSVKRLVRHVIVCDTGSTDGTQGVVRGWLDEHCMEGYVREVPWRGFGASRSEALAHAREVHYAQYTLMIDADEVLEYEPGFNADRFDRALTKDLYDIKTVMGGTSYHRPQLTRTAKPFYYKGALHEYLECDEPFTRDTALGFNNRPIQDSARNKNPRKYLDDAALLERALASETDPFLISRYTFYLARSYHDGGEPIKAIAAYLTRAKLGYWDQERYCSLLYAGRLVKAQDMYGALDLFLRAHAVCPKRHEAIKEAAACAAGIKLRWLANALRTRLKHSTDGLFVEAA